MPKPTKPIARKAELRNKSELRSTSKPARVADLSNITPTRRKHKVVDADELHARLTVENRAQGHCEGCGRPGRCEWSHRIGRAQGGPWSVANGLWLCGDLTGGHCPPDANGSRSHGGGCHPWSHRNPVLAQQRGWILEPHQDPSLAPALVHGVGLVLLAADGGYLPYTEEDIA